MSEPKYVFTKNDPYDRTAPIQFVTPQIQTSKEYMQSIRQFPVPLDALAIWFLGQNGFLLKSSTGQLIGIDLYLTNSCATTFAHLPFRLDRQLPIFIEPEDLDVDIFITTHSHDDHADPETLRRMSKETGTQFLGPFDSMRVYRESGIDPTRCRLIHPGETVELSHSESAQATFALPTDNTDLNHTGVLLRFANGITFYNTGDTAYAERLPALLPHHVDICAICINGGFHNLTPTHAAAIIQQIRPRIVIPCHYDMMVNNVGCPDMLKVALDTARSNSRFVQMRYYEPFLYSPAAEQPRESGSY